MSRRRDRWAEGFEHYFTQRPQTVSQRKLIGANLRKRQFVFETDKGVFAKDHVDLGTKRLIEKVRLPEEGEVLDWGCGYGVIGIFIAATHPNLRVWMVDINERAVALTKRNVKLNRIGNAVVLQSDGFSALPSDLRFDSIVTNPPIHAGKKVLKQLITDAHRWLKVGGGFWLVARTHHGAKTFQRIMAQVFGNAQCVDIHSGYRVLVSVKETETAALTSRPGEERRWLAGYQRMESPDDRHEELAVNQPDKEGRITMKSPNSSITQNQPLDQPSGEDGKPEDDERPRSA